MKLGLSGGVARREDEGATPMVGLTFTVGR